MADYRASVTACILANVHKEKGAKTVEPSDFFPSLGGKKKAMTKEAMRNHMSKIAKKVKK